ncbi:MAG: response regulator [Proteobacteria bacterium]|nr:response regulator [Pseudomonadota bacterium]
MENRDYRSPAEDTRRMRPNERTVRFLVRIIDWIKDIVSSTGAARPRGQVIELRGRKLLPGQKIRFAKILLVEDNPDIAADFIETLRRYYVFGDVMLLVAYGFDAAVSFFSTEDVGLVIMDADLDDEEGDGVELTRRFSEQKQDVTILANSSSALSNMKLTGFGAVEVLGKDPKRLRLWLQTNDPFGAGYSNQVL